MVLALTDGKKIFPSISVQQLLNYSNKSDLLLNPVKPEDDISKDKDEVFLQRQRLVVFPRYCQLVETHPVFNTKEQIVINKVEPILTETEPCDTLLDSGQQMTVESLRSANQYNAYLNIEHHNIKHSLESRRNSHYIISDNAHKAVKRIDKCVSGNIIKDGQHQLLSGNKRERTDQLSELISPSRQSISVLGISHTLTSCVSSSEISMANLRSSSNQMLNCRTIDDGYIENWTNPMVAYEDDLLELSPSIHQPSSVKVRSSLLNNNRAVAGTQNSNNRYSSSVARGFMVVGKPHQPLRPKSLRGRNFYKSEIAPRINLKMSLGSEEFKRRNAVLRKKMKNVYLRPCANVEGCMPDTSSTDLKHGSMTSILQSESSRPGSMQFKKDNNDSRPTFNECPQGLQLLKRLLG